MRPDKNARRGCPVAPLADLLRAAAIAAVLAADRLCAAVASGIAAAGIAAAGALVAAVGRSGAAADLAASACFLARRASALAAGALTSSLPGGHPSGADAVDADTLAREAAFRWWTPSVLLCRASQALRAPPGAGEAPGAGGGPGQDPRLPPRLDALLAAAESRLGAARTGYVFDHGPRGVRVAARRTSWALPEAEALRPGRGLGARRKPAVLAAYVGDRCVTAAVGRVTNLPHPCSGPLQADGYTVTPREAVLAAAAAAGGPADPAGALLVAPRASPVLAY